jgi:WG containing repeat
MIKKLIYFFLLILSFSVYAQTELETIDLPNDLEFFNSNTGNIGIKSKSGEEKIPAKYNAIFAYSSGYLVSKKNKSNNYETTYSYGFYSLTFKEILPLAFQSILPLSDNSFIVSRNSDGKYAVFSSSLKTIIPYEYDFISPKSFDLYRVKKNNLFGFINSEGKLIIENKYNFALPFSEEKAAVSHNDLVGFIDTKGKMIIPARFSTANSFHYNSATVYINNLSSCIDSIGELRFPFVFKSIEPIPNNQFVFETHPKYRGEFEKEVARTAHSFKLNQWAPVVEYTNMDDEGISDQTNQFNFKGIISKDKKIIGGEDFIEVLYLGEINQQNYFAVQTLTEVEENDNWNFILLNGNGEQIGKANHIELRFNTVKQQIEELVIENGEAIWIKVQI